MKNNKSIFLNEVFILWLIIINAVIIFIEGFNIYPRLLNIIEALFTIVFIYEMYVKISTWGAKNYFQEHWNKLDFILILIAIPSLFILFTHKGVGYETNVVMVLRVLRVFKSFRLVKYLPNAKTFLNSLRLALESSYFVIFGFFVMLFIVSLITSSMYSSIAPEYFGNPAISLYSIFQLFSIEGWYEIPDLIAERSSPGNAAFARFYFSVLLLSGGILGLSLVNSIFVDAMVSDNNDELEAEVRSLNDKIDSLESKIDQLLGKKEEN